MVPKTIKITDSASCDSTSQEKSPINPKHTQDTPSLERDVPTCLQLIRQDLAYKGISEEIATVIMDSWRNTTRTKYATVLQQWEKFCIEQKIDPLHGSLKDGLQFMSMKKSQGSKYGVLNNIRSALSTITVVGEIPFGQHQIVCRFMKGIFQNEPPTPKYDIIWDPDLVISFFKNMGPNPGLYLKYLSLKTITLIALATSQRVQTLSILKRTNYILDPK